MQEFSNQVREMGKEGLKDTVLWQRENLIWPERLKWLPQKWQMESLWGHTINKIGQKNQWQKWDNEVKSRLWRKQIYDAQNKASNFNYVRQKVGSHDKSDGMRMNWPNGAQARGMLLLWSLFQRSWQWLKTRLAFIWHLSCYLSALSHALNASKDRHP